MQRDFDWFVKYRGDLDFVTLIFPKMVFIQNVKYYMYHPLCLVEGEKQEENLVLAIPGKVISYNLKDKRKGGL